MVRRSVGKPLEQRYGLAIASKGSWHLVICRFIDALALEMSETPIPGAQRFLAFDTACKGVCLFPVLEPTDGWKPCSCMRVWCSILPDFDTEFEG
jgi:hypothetical protein